MTKQLAVGGALVGFTRCSSTANSISDKPSSATELPPGNAATVSPNYGLNTPDAPARVTSFREELAAALHAPIVWMQQTHSAKVVRLESYQSTAENSVDADAVIVPAGVVAAVQVADCVPVILIDKQHRLVAAVHAGRAGIEKAIISNTVAELISTGSRVEDLYAAVGPCICENCYEVGEDVYRQYVSLFPAGGGVTSWGTHSLRLRAVVVEQLENAGVTRIVHDDTCTFEATDLNSYRREPTCGRQIGWAYFPAEEQPEESTAKN